MIAHLRGKLIYKQPGQAIVEAGGVGYDVAISVPTFTALPSVGAEAALHIHTQVSEDQIALFGFLEREEKRLFERLITVSGVGPKLAIKMLSGLSSERTVQAIRGQDHAQLTRIPGVGKKLAERLVVELKDKLDDFAVAPVQTAVQGAAVDDVLSALMNLGYQRPAAEKAIEQAVAKGQGAGRGFRWAVPRGAEGDPVDHLRWGQRPSAWRCMGSAIPGSKIGTLGTRGCATRVETDPIDWVSPLRNNRIEGFFPENFSNYSIFYRGSVTRIQICPF